MHLTWTLLTMPPLNYTIAGTLILHSTIFRWRQREGSGFSENLPKRHDSTSTLSEWLVPTLWSLVLISLAVTSAVYVHLLCVLLMSLSRTLTTLVLCRSLAGVNQRITLPLFYTVIILQIISSSLIVTGPLYHNWVGMSSVYCTLFHSFLRVFYCSPPTFLCRCNTFIITYYPDLSRGCPRGGAHRVGCTDLTTHLSHGLC